MFQLGAFQSGSLQLLQKKERDEIEGKAGRRRRIEVEAGVEEEAGLRRVKRRSGMFGGILIPSLSLSLCCKAISIRESISKRI